jgi:hypothetical protein
LDHHQLIAEKKDDRSIGSLLLAAPDGYLSLVGWIKPPKKILPIAK